MVAMRDSVQDQEVPFPEDSAVPHEMRAIVNRMCAFRASDRYASAVQAIEDLRRFQMSRSLPTAKEWGEIGETIQDIIQVRKATTAKIEIPKIEKPAAPRIKAPPLKPKIDPVDALVLEDHPTAPSHTNATYRRREAIRIERTNNRPKWIIAAVFASVALFAAWTRFHSAKSNAPVAKAHQPLPEPLVLIQPSDQEEFVLSKTRTPTFEWTRALRPDEYDIQIATDSAFKQIVVQEAVAGRSYRPERQLTEGLYFWRLRPKKPNLLAPTAYRFTVAPRTPVRLIAPAAQHVFILMPRVEYMDIDVRWECKPVAKAYRIQASTRPDFSRAFVDRKLSACKTQIEKLDAGRYFWRVRMESVDGEEEPWSQGLSFTVQDAKASRLPTSRSN